MFVLVWAGVLLSCVLFDLLLWCVGVCWRDFPFGVVGMFGVVVWCFVVCVGCAFRVVVMCCVFLWLL